MSIEVHQVKYKYSLTLVIQVMVHTSMVGGSKAYGQPTKSKKVRETKIVPCPSTSYML